MELSMSDFRRTGLAIVVDSGDVAQMLCETLQGFGYRAISAPTHALAAERAAAHDDIALLAACVPAPDEGRTGVYLETASRSNSRIAVVLMLADPLEQSPDAPARAVKIVKPFGRKTLIGAIELAEAKLDQG
jgi:DNA-binding response OmpR family regulator